MADDERTADPLGRPRRGGEGEAREQHPGLHEFRECLMDVDQQGGATPGEPALRQQGQQAFREGAVGHGDHGAGRDEDDGRDERALPGEDEDRRQEQQQDGEHVEQPLGDDDGDDRARPSASELARQPGLGEFARLARRHREQEAGQEDGEAAAPLQADVELPQVHLPANEAQPVVDGGQQQHDGQRRGAEVPDQIADLLEVADEAERGEGDRAQQEQDQQAPSDAAERLVVGELHERRHGR